MSGGDFFVGENKVFKGGCGVLKMCQVRRCKILYRDEEWITSGTAYLRKKLMQVS